GRALRGKDEAVIVTKVGYFGDPETRKIAPEDASAAAMALGRRVAPRVGVTRRRSMARSTISGRKPRWRWLMRSARGCSTRLPPTAPAMPN
ncbi:hypothetical protein NKI04_06400, partial [Mesorhizobium sp. M0814]